MIEFDAQEGGRYTYVDDIVNLQNLALSFCELFSECDNFILSGCEVSGTSISAGYVYINGKLRHFSGATGITQWPQYIYESNKTESVAYASGADKVGRNVYGCTIGKVVPTTLDPLTNKVPSSLLINKTGNKTFKEAFIGKYALLLSGAGTQRTDGTVNFGNVVANEVTATSAYNLRTGNAQHRKFYDGGNLVYQTQYNNGKQYRFVVEEGQGYSFYIGDKKIITLGENGVVFGVKLNNQAAVNISELGSLAVSENAIYNNTDASNTGTLNINVVGHQGSKSYFRNTNIGDGKGNNILSFTGSNKAITGYGVLTLQNDNAEGIILKSKYAKSNLNLQKYIAWRDGNNELLGYVGYGSGSDNQLWLRNHVADVVVKGEKAVDLGPAIKENGVLLEQKYIQRSELAGLVAGKAEASAVYSKTDADNTFAKKSGGLSQFATGSVTTAHLRTQIGAASTEDVNKKATLSSYLSDMATDEAAKKKIRDNIGAAAAGEALGLKDSGWIRCSGNSGDLYARQVGNVVSIQGTVRTVHSGVVFNVPNTIDPPTYDVYQSISFNNSTNWACAIKGGARACKVEYCMGGCYETSSFSMTYMV